MKHYVEDKKSQFRFAYPVDFLKWALLAPGYAKNWHLAVRQNKKLVGFISGIPISINIGGKTVRVAEINFLCVHKKLRSKKLAPLLIKEITRRVNLNNIWQAIYTAGIIIPKPIVKTTYFHRNLQTKKLIDIGFSHLPQGIPLARYLKMNKVPDIHESGLKGIIKPM